MEARPVSISEVTMTELVLPSHTNALGSIFGGVVMSWIDIAAAIAAQRHSRSNVVTASVDALYFVAPIYTGWIVNLRAAVNYVSNTSMEVGVRVEAENPQTGKKYHTSTAYLTFVAVDSEGKPHKIPQVMPESAEQKRRYDRAKVRRQERLKKIQSPS
ncbi:MAG: acyl-CoA thioesterase [Bdellovibrionales bacterium]